MIEYQGLKEWNTPIAVDVEQRDTVLKGGNSIPSVAGSA